MLDRMISGAGAVTDGADRSVRLLTSGSGGSPAASRPGSVAVAILLFALSGLLVLAGVEASDPTTARSLDPAAIARASAGDPGARTYATMDGSLLTTWVETYEDSNDNGVEDADEHGIAWYYWLVDPEVRRGVTVRSTRAPASIFTFEGSGIVIDDPTFDERFDQSFTDEVAAAGLTLAPDIVIDTTHAVGETIPMDLAADAPSRGTAVAVSGPRTGVYLAVCTSDSDRDRVCDENEVNAFEVVVFDPASKRAIRVLLDEPPEFSPASLTGVLRREERAVDDAQQVDGFDFSHLDIDVSDRYVLDEAVPPGSAPLAFVLALALAAIAGIILVGLAGGYLIYRRSPVSLPAAATTLGPGERIPVRISGVVRTPTGLGHLREAPGDLTRFVLGRPVVTPGDAPLPDEDAAAIATTLIVERSDAPEGVALGLGELRRVSAGQVMTLRAPRPALRVVAGTGPLLLSFDTGEERDRAAAELLDESGLGPDGVLHDTT